MFLVCAVIAVLLGTVHGFQCTRLPTKNEIQLLLQSVVNSIDGIVEDLLSHHFTCIAPTQSLGEIKEVSIAVIFDYFTTEMGINITRREQFQLFCSEPGVNNWGATYLEENPPAVAFNLTTRRDCFLCDPDGIRVDTDANCNCESLSDLILCTCSYLAILFSCMQCVPAGVVN